MLFRNAADADLEAELAVFGEAEGELYRRHGYTWPEPRFEVFARPHRHLLAVDGDRAFVAEEEGRVVGFSAAFVRGDAWFLSALFVLPSHQGRGVGRRLLELSWGEGHRRRMTITDAIQPVSTGLYAARGLIPATPVLRLAGEPRAERPPDLEPTDPEPGALAAIDLAAYGFDRTPDHGHWSTAAAATLWLREGRPVAYSYATADGAIGPIAGHDPASAADALTAELARHAAADVTIPGSARALVAAALSAGLRFTAPPGLLMLSGSVEPPRGLAISGYWLL